MKSLLLLSLTLSSLLTLAAQDLRVMTYNIRLDTDWDGDDRWDLRKAFLADQVRFYDPAIMGAEVDGSPPWLPSFAYQQISTPH